MLRPGADNIVPFAERYRLAQLFEAATNFKPLLAVNTSLQTIQGQEYCISTLLEAAGMGEVYLAQEARSAREVIVKVPNTRQGDQLADWFVHREQRFPEDFQHPNVVQTLGSGNHDGLPFVVMEYIEGLDLEAWALTLHCEGKRPSWREVCRIAKETALGLAAAHAVGIFHRDIKPANLIRDHIGQTKILDWGLVRFAQQPMSELATNSQRLLGTDQYLSPEQAANPRDVDARSDLYSLGCTMYRLLTGEPPFSNHRTPASQLQAHKSAPRPSIRALRPDMPRRIDRLIRKAMAIDPKERFQSAKHFVRGLDREMATGLKGVARRWAYETGQYAIKQSKKLGRELRTVLIIGVVVWLIGLPWGLWDSPPPPEQAVDVDGKTLLIPVEARAKYPELVELIRTSTDLKADERQRWMERLPRLENEERHKLYKRLLFFKMATTQKGMVVPADLREKFPHLVDLILNSESMKDRRERYHWLSMLYVLNEEGRLELQRILEKERDELALIDRSIGPELDADAAARRAVFISMSRSKDAKERRTAAAGLMNLPYSRLSVLVLERLFEDEDKDVRVVAAFALAKAPPSLRSKRDKEK